MKKGYVIQSLVLAVTFGVLFFLQSCSKLAGLINYNVTLNTGTVTFYIPPTPAGILFDTLGTATSTYNVDSFIKATTANTLSTSNITSVKLSSCVLTILSGANATNSFGNFGSCTASFSSNSESTPYQLGYPSIPATYTTALTMPVDTTTQLKSYLNGSTFNYSISGTVRNATTDTLTCTIQYVFNIAVQG